ncbi:MAG: hypothetical protein WBD19_09660, partial [Candidatus Acidiferrum sp.]
VMAFVDEPVNEINFELQRLSETVYWRFTKQCDTFVTQRMEDLLGFLDISSRSCCLGRRAHGCRTYEDQQQNEEAQGPRLSQR